MEKTESEISSSATITNNDNKKKEGPSTISIAVPGSILENAQSVELRTYVVGQIARAACIFRVNEIVVFDDLGPKENGQMKFSKKNNVHNMEPNGNQSETVNVRYCCLQMARILQYLECPQYLRKFFFPLHKDLKYSGLLNPLDAPHHLRQQNAFRYREGIVTETPSKTGQCYVNVGLLNEVLVNQSVKSGLRVTVKLNTPEVDVKKQSGSIVNPEEPRRETGTYWGYTVRIANCLSEVFTKCPYPNGYDITVGTSDRGQSIHSVTNNEIVYNHLLIVFGGLHGLEAALNNDNKLNVDEPQLLFDYYMNVLPEQGSRTIRTEEALLIALTAVQDKICARVPEIKTEKQTQIIVSRTGASGHLNNIPKQRDKARNKVFKRKLNGDFNTIKIAPPKQTEENNINQKETNETNISKKVIRNPFKPQPPPSDEPVVDFEIVPQIPINAKSKKVKRKKRNNNSNGYDNDKSVQLQEDLNRFD